MKLETYNQRTSQMIQLDALNESFTDLLEYYLLFSELNELHYFSYDYELNQYEYQFSLAGSVKIIQNDISVDSFEYTLIIEKNKNIFGILAFNEKPKRSYILDQLFEKIQNSLNKIFSLKQKFITLESKKFDIYLIADESSKEFSNKLEGSLKAIINTDIKIVNSVDMITETLKQKTKKSILIYIVEDEQFIKKEELKLQHINEFLIVIGPDSYDLSLYCGRLQVLKYLSKESFIPEQIKSLLSEIKSEVQNKYVNTNKIITIAGIAGGIGTTTVAMNTANMISKYNSSKNVLYIDLSLTKAISNLFLEQNPMPKKTIIDLVNSSSYDIEKNLSSGLVKVKENFYAISGIQKHIDSDYLEQEVFIEKLLEYLAKIGETFNYIIIDTGEATASTLKSTLYDISNELWILTEMSLPHISKLKTFFSLMKRAGLKDKLSFIVNRYDSEYAISVSDVTSILNTANEEHLKLEFKIPNDYVNIGYCWNYCELVTNTYPNSSFSNVLHQILLNKKLIEQETVKKEKSSLFSFLGKKANK